MKRCPECRRDYFDDSLSYCLDDGTALLEGPATADSTEPLTAKMQIPTTPSQPDAEAPTRTLDADLISKELQGHKFRSALIILVGVLILTGFGYGIYKFLDRSSVPQPQRTSANIEIQRLSGDGKTRSPVISPDGKFMVYVKLEGGESSLWIKQVQTGSNVNVVKPGESDAFWGITFSPDGNFVYYNAYGRSSKDAPTVFRVPTLGGTPTKFVSNAFLVKFSHDGKQISFRRSDISALKETVFIANADGSQEREVASRTGTQFFATSAPWSPDGKFLAVGVGDDSLAPEPSMVLALISVADGKVTEFGKTWEGVGEIAWHPSGDSLLVVASENSYLPGQVWELSYPGAEYRKLTNDVNGHFAVSITSDGNSVVTGELFARSSVWVSPDLRAENAKQIMPATGDTWGIAWTPDGRIIYSSAQTGAVEIWIMNADGSEARPLTSDKILKLVPTVSPDGRYIVYTSTLNGGELIRINIDGGYPHVLTKSNGADNPDVSPDGTWVIYSAYFNGIPKILRVPIDGGDGQVLTPDVFATEPRYSNDGTRFACFLLDPKSLAWNKIAIYPADGGQALQTLDVPSETNRSRGPVWTPDDKNIVVVISLGEKQNLWQVPVDGEPGRQITDFDVPGIARREYSPDGKRIAVVRAEGFGNAIMITGFR